MYAISTALGGMTSAVARFDRAASDIVRSASGASTETAVVESIQAEHQFRASAAVTRAADDMLGVLLDIRA